MILLLILPAVVLEICLVGNLFWRDANAAAEQRAEDAEK